MTSPHGYGRRAWLALALSATHACAAAAAPAAGDDARWWRFFGDDAHAIDRARLKFRADGLLESASRYPRTSAQGWTAEQHERGWYEYQERLIDCRTGLALDTALALLDRDSQPIARRESSYESQLEKIALRQDEVIRHTWPENSELWLACALAARGAEVVPGDKLAPGFDYDYDAIGDTPPADGRGLFERLRAQYDHNLAGYAPALPAPAKAATAHPLRGERWLVSAHDSSTRFDLASLRHRGDGRIEVSARVPAVERLPQDLPEEVQIDQVTAIDCRNGLAVPVEQRFHAAVAGRDSEPNREPGRELLRRSAPVLGTLTALARQSAWSRPNGWNEWLGPANGLEAVADPDAARLCRIAAQRCRADARDPTQAGTPLAAFELAPERLSTQAGAPLLLSARALWLEHRASFVPSCPIGEP